MRLFHVYSGNLYGGVERALVAIAAAAPSGIRQTFVLAYDGRLRRELRATGAEVVTIGAARARAPWTIWCARRELAALLPPPETRAILLAHSLWTLAVVGPVARAAGVPTAIYLHNPPTAAPWPDGWARGMPVDLAIANSRYTAEVTRPYMPDVPIECMYPPVEQVARVAADRLQIRQELGTAPEEVVILQASRMQAWKGHATLVGALAAMRDTAGWTAWIAGGAQRPAEHAYEASIRKAAADAGLDGRVRFLGERTDAARLFGAADIYCQPNSEPEPFGVAFIEALAAELAVVTSEAGGALEIVDADSGRLVPPGDTTALAATLRTLVADHPLRRSLGTRGPARARALCDPHTQTARLIELLRNVACP